MWASLKFIVRPGEPKSWVLCLLQPWNPIYHGIMELPRLEGITRCFLGEFIQDLREVPAVCPTLPLSCPWPGGNQGLHRATGRRGRSSHSPKSPPEQTNEKYNLSPAVFSKHLPWDKTAISFQVLYPMEHLMKPSCCTVSLLHVCRCHFCSTDP